MENLVLFYVSGDDSGQKALAHCRSGKGRTGTKLMILIKMLQDFYGTKNKIMLSETLALVRAQRSYLCEKKE